MSRRGRREFIFKISALINAPVLAYVTSDRRGMDAHIDSTHVTMFPRHLRHIGDVERLAVLLYTRGGSPSATWSIINHLREHCNELIVLAPSHIHSAGTLLALGADEIVMGRYSSISPIDPTVANGFSPVNETDPTSRIPIQTEDVHAYLDFVERHTGSASGLLGLGQLTQHLHPLALGNVQRSVDRIRYLARKMLCMHETGRNHPDVEGLLDELTTLSYSHRHMFSRHEAAQLGLAATAAIGEMDELLHGFHLEIQKDLQLLDPFDPATIVYDAMSDLSEADASLSLTALTELSVPIRAERVYIETTETLDTLVTHGEVWLKPTDDGDEAGSDGLSPVFETISNRWESTA